MGFITPEVPASIGTLRFFIKETPIVAEDGTRTFRRTIEYSMDIFDANGVKLEKSYDHGDLLPHLTLEQKQALLAIVQDVRARAEAEIIP